MNTAPIDPKNVTRNAWRESMQDGLLEFFFGFYFITIAALLQSHLMGLMVLLIIFTPAILKRLKARYTYPRIGYVEFPVKEASPGPWIVALLAAAVAVPILVVILTGAAHEPRLWYKWTPLFAGILLGGLLFPMGIKTGLVRFHVMAALALIGSIGFGLLTLPGKLDYVSLYLMALGALSAVWGGITFLVFLRRNPVQPEAARHGR